VCWVRVNEGVDWRGLEVPTARGGRWVLCSCWACSFRARSAAQTHAAAGASVLGQGGRRRPRLKTGGECRGDLPACTCVLSFATIVATTSPCTDRTQEHQIAELMTKIMQAKLMSSYNHLPLVPPPPPLPPPPSPPPCCCSSPPTSTATNACRLCH
jgi:hypothetical protein